MISKKIKRWEDNFGTIESLQQTIRDGKITTGIEKETEPVIIHESNFETIIKTGIVDRIIGHYIYPDELDIIHKENQYIHPNLISSLQFLTEDNDPSKIIIRITANGNTVDIKILNDKFQNYINEFVRIHQSKTDISFDKLKTYVNTDFTEIKPK